MNISNGFSLQKLLGIRVGNGSVYDRTRPNGERQKGLTYSDTEGKDQRRETASQPQGLYS